VKFRAAVPAQARRKGSEDPVPFDCMLSDAMPPPAQADDFIEYVKNHYPEVLRNYVLSSYVCLKVASQSKVG